MKLLLQTLLEDYEDVVTGLSQLDEILGPGRIHVGTMGCSCITEKRKGQRKLVKLIFF